MRVFGGVGGGVPVGRVVTAPHVTALEADPQVQPLAAGGEALLAAVDGLGQLGDVDVVEMGALAAWVAPIEVEAGFIVAVSRSRIVYPAAGIH